MGRDGLGNILAVDEYLSKVASNPCLIIPFYIPNPEDVKHKNYYSLQYIYTQITIQLASKMQDILTVT